MALAGENIDAADINALQRFYAIKVADESVTSSVTPQNDDDLSAVLDVGVWEVHLNLAASGAAAGDILIQWNTSGTMTCLARQTSGPSTVATSTLGSGALPRYSASTSFTAVPLGVDGTNITCFYDHLIVDVDVAGTLVLQWAQNVSSGTATIVRAGSNMTWRLLAEG